MALSIRFYLDKYDSVNHSKICLFVTLEKKCSKVSTGLSIPVKFWDKERELAKSNYNLSSYVNQELNKIRQYCEFLYIELSRNGKIVRETYLTKVKAMLKKSEIEVVEVKSKSFYELWDEFINFSDKNQRVLPRVINSYKRAKRYFQEFAPKVTFDDLDENLMIEYRTHLLEEKYLQINGALPYFKNGLFVFLNWALKNGHTTNIKYKNFKIYATERMYNMYLTLEEIDRINELQGLSKYLDNARSWLNIMCYTGLRISDAIRLSKSHIKRDSNIVDIVAKKTNRRLNIPIIPRIEKYIQKIENEDIYVISEQKLNDYYKILGKLAGINDDMTVTEFRPHRVESVVPKYTLIENQCFRRTFATNSLQLKIPAAIVMKITDHKSMASFEKYIGFSLKNAVDELSDAWGKVKT